MREGDKKIFKNDFLLNELIRKYQEGVRVNELARIYKCDHSSINWRLKKSNVWSRRNSLPTKKSESAEAKEKRRLVAIKKREEIKIRIEKQYKEQQEKIKLGEYKEREKRVAAFKDRTEERLTKGKSYKEYLKDAKARGEKTTDVWNCELGSVYHSALKTKWRRVYGAGVTRKSLPR